MNTAITTLNGPWSTLWFGWMTAMSWQVAVLVAALFALGWMLQRQSARLRYSLWSLVLLRLVLPPTLALATGWAWWILPVQEVPRTPLVEARSPEPSTPSHLVYPYRQGPSPFESAPSSRPIEPSTPSTAQQSSPPWPWKAWLLCGWLLGSTVMAVRLLRGLLQVRQLVRSSISLEESELNQLLRDCCRRVGVPDVPRLHESALIETPLLIGYWQPTILVPLRIQEQLSPAELETVLFHELHHIHRHDAAVSLLQAALKAIYFFHPAVWLADRWLRRLREEACDEATVSVLAGHRRDYGSAILKLAELTLQPASPLAIGVVETGSHITQRMRRILDPQLPTGRTLSWSALALVVMAAATLLPAGPRQKVLTQDPQEADAGIKPVEFRIVPATLPQDEASIRWLPIRQQPVSKKDSGIPPNIAHARPVEGRWEAPVWDLPEHALLASDKWHVVECDAQPDANNPMLWTLTITLDEQGGNAFRTLSTQHLKQHLAIIVHGEIISAPTINDEIGSNLQITGAFTKEAAQALADAISQPATKPESKAAPAKDAPIAPVGATTETATSSPKPEPPDPQATVRGVVVDAEGKPVAGARVVLPSWERVDSLWKEVRMEANTDALGQFELTSTRQKMRLHWVRAFADGGEKQAAVQLPENESEIGVVDLKLELAAARRVELHVVDQNGWPVENASCGVNSELKTLGTIETDQKGQAIFLLPSTISVQHVFAVKGGVGLDYRAYVLPLDQRGDRKSKSPELPAGPLTLTLEGVHSFPLRVMDSSGAPLGGLHLAPLTLSKPGQPDDLSLVLFGERFRVTTDAKGEALLNWVPTWHPLPLEFVCRNDDYSPHIIQFDPRKGTERFTMTLDRLVPIRGRVTNPDGSPAVGIEISANGVGDHDHFSGSTKTTDDGRYELKVAPQMSYLVTALGDKLASDPQLGFEVVPNQPRENVDFVLRPATRLFGRVSFLPGRSPAKQTEIIVLQHGADIRLTSQIKKPNSEETEPFVYETRPMIATRIKTDEHGNYELYVGSGKFSHSGTRRLQDRFEIDTESERQSNIELPAEVKTGILKGRVLNAAQVPAVNATITVLHGPQTYFPKCRAMTDAEGFFEVERYLASAALQVVSEDGQLAGVGQVGAQDDTVNLTIGPLGSATGRLIDAQTGAPKAGAKIAYGPRTILPSFGEAFETPLLDEVITDRNGRFELKSLVVGQMYDLDSPGPYNDVSFPSLKSFTPKSSATINLGDLR